jgi:A/G-specific adenine glycosylase
MRLFKPRASRRAIREFRKKVKAYFRAHGRRMPWRETDDPYKILISELMLQQTQVDRVTGKYGDFLKAFPTVEKLASSPLSAVVKAWQGLGYNRRAVFLKKAAEIIVKKHSGRIPDDIDALRELPGIGPATAGALRAFAFGKPSVFIETNIRSVFIHHFFRDRHGVTDEELMPLIGAAVDRGDPRNWYYALMDYGVMLKRSHPNPSRRSASHKTQGRFEGSDRQVRGKVLRHLSGGHSMGEGELRALIPSSRSRLHRILKALVVEGFLERRDGAYRLRE